MRTAAYCESPEIYCKLGWRDCGIGGFGANAAAPGTAEGVSGASGDAICQFDWFAGLTAGPATVERVGWASGAVVCGFSCNAATSVA